MISRQDQRAYQEWQDLCERISQQTQNVAKESPGQKQKRIKYLKGNFEAFCKYYFAHFMDADFAWFHKKAAKKIKEDKNIFAILEWPREHAKSVFANIMIPMFLYANEELTGMIVGSATQDKAKGLLGDIQAQFQSNQLWINDYGQLCSLGNWQDGNFMTTDGIGFWAFGRGQSPRGVRKANKRPNYGSIDDIDDKIIVRNQTRVKDALAWVLEDFFGALSIKNSRLIISGNRIHKHSILAHLVGDTEPKEPKRKGITHIKVYAIENKAHRKADFNNGQPAWKERYTLSELRRKMEKMGTLASRREFFHEHIEEGIIFKNEWIQWGKCPKIREYDALVCYCDPSFKDKAKNDYKAVVLVGKKGNKYYVDRAWIRKASIKSMVMVHFDIYDDIESHARYYMEANALQDLLMGDFEKEGDSKGYYVPLRKDKRAKPPKEVRIENLSPLFERGLFIFNEKHRANPDMQTLVQQFLAFPAGHDDGPDATEGATNKLNKISKAGTIEPRYGSRTNRSRR